MCKEENPENYMPVSVTLNPGKVILLEVINKYIENKKVIRSSQHGFIKEKLCLAKLIAFYDEMSSSVDRGIVYCDFRKILTQSIAAS